MIQRNNNLSVLPFYEDADERSSERTYAYGEVYPLYTPMGTVPPFQIIRSHDGATINEAVIHRVGDGTSMSVLTEMEAAGLQVVEYSAYGYDIVMYPSLAPHNLTTEEGRHYMTVTMSDGTTYYSDIFTVVGSITGYLNIRWWDAEDLVMDGERICYAGNYKNSIWLATQLGKPDYDFEEEGEVRDGVFFLEKSISQKRYKCTFLANEALCDVMRFIRLSDVVRVRDRYGNVYRCDTFLATPKWQEQGDLASVEVEFTCETVAKKIGNGYLDLGRRDDFNDDYNNDYDIATN